MEEGGDEWQGGVKIAEAAKCEAKPRLEYSALDFGLGDSILEGTLDLELTHLVHCH